MTTYVLVPGACHGAWCFDDLAAALRNEGHRVLSYTLTGVAERAHLATDAVFDPRASAHPLASFLQRITLTGDLNGFRRRDFVYALKWPGDSPMRPSYERVKDDAGSAQ